MDPRHPWTGDIPAHEAPRALQPLTVPRTGDHGRSVIGRRTRLLLAVVASVLAVAGYWHVYGQEVEVLLINESGRPLTFSWQPSPFLDEVSVLRNGCESGSLVLHRGQSWRLEWGDGVIANSLTAVMPPFARLVVVEIRIDRSGSVLVSPPLAVDAPVGAQVPDCTSGL
jgi:hypothetical protein